MDIQRPNAQPLSEEEQAELDHLKKIIEAAIADGVLTAPEMERIKQQMGADGKVSLEELELYRLLVQEKISQGLLNRDIG
ncbi:hypothetical protein L3556_01720 [Candidatus Synechococcus calcipolaris G9]|uniref:Uncharacterized protein n=1 Tax=Candidatus Synechococcus calcipolaris G9 TaxID=1497997 RepID=A0ABT6EV02_9SYNE|nr:hypothetical protein [Candidatus Synechococcus calcipolaris]MDG2989657.1 hypothetical protein [Candidatus Synechococcus calcipolaris G9]